MSAESSSRTSALPGCSKPGPKERRTPTSPTPHKAGPGSYEQQLAGHDLDVEGGEHLGVQPDRDPVRAEGLDRRGELDPTLVQGRTAGGLDRIGDVRGGDRAEQPALGPSAGGQTDRERLELVGHDVGRRAVPDLADVATLADQRRLLLRATVGDGGQALRDKEVAAVAVLDLDDVAGTAETGDLLLENQLHVGVS